MAANHPPVDRRARRKAATRAKLLEAAQAVFARQGIDATRINEITEEADVGFGSFYNHFESKDAVVAALVEDTVGAIGVAINAATASLDDPAEVVSAAHRTLVRWAAEDPEFGWLLVRLEATHDLATSALRSYAVRDIKRGLDSARFDVVDPDLALAATGGALLGVVKLVLRGHALEDAATRHAAGVLRLLGVPAGEAERVAARPLPAVTVAGRDD
jgi:AcrR family transcriptional regulator